MSARDGDFRRAFCALLAFDLRKVCGIARFAALPALGRMREYCLLSAHMRAELGKRTHGQNGNAFHIRRFLGVAKRHGEHRFALAERVYHHGQHARDGADAAIQPQFAERHKLHLRVCAQLAGRA
ncbi:hypothetical protein SDC9_62868 [bioreactor metagenome]|uniref:Uncharacterized protein n=1 Tax=bioreactor metagenome TaxID=1076179 RepID=A0A644XKI4_9ZZZZ